MVRFFDIFFSGLVLIYPTMSLDEVDLVCKSLKKVVGE